MRDRIDRRLAHFRSNQRILSYARRVVKDSRLITGEAPVVFFNTSTRIEALSQNAAFSLLASWSLRLQGIPIHQFICKAGMTRCVLGTNRDDASIEPPCRACVNQSKVLFGQNEHTWFEYHADPLLDQMLDGLNLDGMENFQFAEIPLGKLVLPSLRWTLRRHNLDENDQTKAIFKHFIKSAWSVARNFEQCLEQLNPQAVVVFNGQFFPEAVARYMALKKGIRVISHEVALQPLSGYFTEGEATAYPIQIPASFQLDDSQNKRLDDYLEQRFQGEFSMAGIRFWPKMQALSPEFWAKAGNFKQIVPIFTNVVFDTSQGHANVLYPHMFAWLDDLLAYIKENTQTYFVIRAHPDEDRIGKESRETVADWVKSRKIDQEPNVLFVDSSEYFSSYELIQKAKFILVYNSTIGLEASILGAPVLCAGKARYTQLPTVFFPASLKEYHDTLQRFFNLEEIPVPEEFRENARRFLYYQLFLTSLPFNEFVEEDGIWRGYVKLKQFETSALSPEHSETMKTLTQGILKGHQFVLRDIK